MPDSPIYRAAWASYRRRKYLFFASMIFLLPGTAFLSILLPRAFGSNPPMLLVFPLMALPAIAAGIRLMVWRCPRCDKTFHLNWPVGNLVAGRCLHCGLPLYSAGDPDS